MYNDRSLSKSKFFFLFALEILGKIGCLLGVSWKPIKVTCMCGIFRGIMDYIFWLRIIKYTLNVEWLKNILVFYIEFVVTK